MVISAVGLSERLMMSVVVVASARLWRRPRCLELYPKPSRQLCFLQQCSLNAVVVYATHKPVSNHLV